MDAEGGKFFYLVATSLAGFVVALAALSYFLDAPKGMPVISAAALALAAIIWLIGWAGRHVLAGR